MNAMILAAGLGTRLGAIGAATPKILIAVGGRPLLQRHLDYLWRNGVRRVVINLHHQADAVEEFVAGYDGPLEVLCSYENQLLGTAGGVRHALAQLEPGPFCVIYGDIIVQDDLAGLINCHKSSNALVTLAVHTADDAEGKGTVEVDERGRVTRFAEKQAGAVTGPVLINSGIYVLETQAVEELAPGVFCDFGEQVFPRLLAQRALIMAFRLRVPVIDIGTPEGLSLANATLAGAANPS